MAVINRKAFTLVEMMLVLTIIVFMVGMAVPLVLKDINKSNLQIATKELRNELKRYQLLSKSQGKQIVFKYEPESSSYFFDKEKKQLLYDLKFDPGDNTKIVFYPNGRCEDITIKIQQERKKGVIKIQGMTGRISIDFVTEEPKDLDIYSHEDVRDMVEKPRDNF